MAHPSIYLPIYLSSVFYWFCFSWKAWLMKWILLFPFQESPERLYGTPLPTSHLAKSDRCRIQIQHFSASAQATKATSLLLYGIPTLCSVDPSLRSSSQIRYKHQVSWSQCLQGNQFTTPQVSSLKNMCPWSGMIDLPLLYLYCLWVSPVLTVNPQILLNTTGRLLSSCRRVTGLTR